MAASESEKGLLRAELLRELKLDGHEPLAGARPDPSLVGAAASIMARRTFFGTEDVRSITAYVQDVFTYSDPGSHHRARVAEALIRSELGELELLAGIHDQVETLDLARHILFDLCRRSRMDAAGVDRLIDQAAKEAEVVRSFTESKRLSGRGLLTRALRRRAGRTLDER